MSTDPHLPASDRRREAPATHLVMRAVPKRCWDLLGHRVDGLPPRLGGEQGGSEPMIVSHEVPADASNGW